MKFATPAPSFSFGIWPWAGPLALLPLLMVLGPRLMPHAFLFAVLITFPVLAARWPMAKSFFARPVLPFLFLALIYTCASAAWSPSDDNWARAIDLSYITLGATVLAAVAAGLNPDAAGKLALGFALGWLAAGALGIFEFSLDHPVYRWIENIGPAHPVEENMPKRVAGLFALTVWVVAGWLHFRRGKTSAFALLTGFFLFSLFSTSRSAMAGMMAGLVAWGFAWLSPLFMRRVLMAAVLGGLIFTVPVFTLIPHLPPEISKALPGSFVARVAIWNRTAETALTAPLFGQGLDASRGTKREVKEGEIPGITPGFHAISTHPHNVFLQLWFDLGALGVVLWGALSLLLLRATRFLHFEVQPYALGAFACGLAMLCTTFSVVQAWWLAGYITAALLLFLLSQSRSSSAGISGASAGGMA